MVGRLSPKEEFMELTAIDLRREENFTPDSIPQGSADFYQTASFATNLCKTLGNVIDESNKAEARSQAELKKAFTES
jgi:hypothetical protein